MKSAALDVVQEFYSFFRDGNMAKVFALLSEDIVWRLVGPTTIPYFGTYCGIREVKRFFAILDEYEQIDEFRPVKFLEGVNSVTVLG
jgi:ketosteroid isomerase-like protein